MRTLIYTLAYGSEYWQCARLMVQSLRSWGEYTGDVIVYADQDGVIDGASVIRNTVPCALPLVHLSKALFGMSLPQGYDRYLYFDADIVILNSVQPLLEYAHPLTMPIEIEEAVVTWREWFSLPQLPSQPGDKGFNSGTISADGNEWARICNLWWDVMVENKIWTIPGGYDQRAINHLGRVGAVVITPFPKEWFYFFTEETPPLTRSTIIVHTKNHKIPTMRHILGMRSLWT